MIEKELLNELIEKTKKTLNVRPFNLKFIEEKTLVVVPNDVNNIINLEDKNEDNNALDILIDDNSAMEEEKISIDEEDSNTEYLTPDFLNQESDIPEDINSIDDETNEIEEIFNDKEENLNNDILEVFGEENKDNNYDELTDVEEDNNNKNNNTNVTADTDNPKSENMEKTNTKEEPLKEEEIFDVFLNEIDD